MSECNLNICKARLFNARRATFFGYELTMTDRLVFVKSDPYTHIEWQFSDSYANISFSASFQDGGCRFKNIGYSTPAYWDTIEIPLTNIQEDAAYHKAEELNGKEYDWIGAVLFNPDKPEQKLDPNKYICSETWAELYVATGHNLMRLPERYMPTYLETEIRYWQERIRQANNEPIRIK